MHFLPRRLIGRKAKADGDACERLVESILCLAGVPFLQRIHTGWLIIRSAGRVIDAKPKEKVAGDRWGCLQGGRCLLVEVKERAGDVLAWDDLEPHQHDALSRVHRAGGLAVVAWVTPDREAILMDYPIQGWVKGKPLHLAQARAVAQRCSIPKGFRGSTETRPS